MGLAEIAGVTAQEGVIVKALIAMVAEVEHPAAPTLPLQAANSPAAARAAMKGVVSLE